MTFYSQTLETCKQYDAEQKGHFLAEAINNANKDSSLLTHNESNDDWVNIAMTLLDDPSTPTHYVPLRDLVKCLAKGNIDLAIKLYHSPDNHELQYRANRLLSELIYTAQGNKQLLAQINEINHSLCIITFIKDLKNTKQNGGSIHEIQNTILRDLITQTNLDTILDLTSIERDIHFVLSQKLDTRANIVQTLPYLKKIVLNHPLCLLQEVIETKTIQHQNSYSDFLADIILNQEGKINIALTLGLDENMFAELPNQKAALDFIDCDKTLKTPPPIKKTSYRILNDSFKSISTIHNPFKNSVEKTPNAQNSIVLHSLEQLPLGSVKNFVESEAINPQPTNSDQNDEKMMLDSKEGPHKLYHTISHTPTELKSSKPSKNNSSMSQTLEILSSSQDLDKNQCKYQETDTKSCETIHHSNTGFKKNSTNKTSQQNHTKQTKASFNWLSQKFFNKNSKIAATDNTEKQKSTTSSPKSFQKTDNTNMQNITNMEETNKIPAKLYDKYHQSQYSADDLEIYSTTVEITGDDTD